MSDYLMPTYGRFPVTLVSGHGVFAVDENGKEYLDLGSGIGVNALGYCEPGWVAAVQAQAATIQHMSNLYYCPLQDELAERLCAVTGMSAAFLCNSGAEANECATKLARKYSFDKYGSGRATILTLENSFHGRTITTLSATGQDVFHTYFAPFTEGFASVPADNIAAMEAADDGSVCAVLIECIQGEGGVVPIDEEYLRAVRALCSAHDWLLLIDEVQTGAGRTGKFLACEYAGVKPDVVTLAKGVGGGIPIGVCLAAEPFARVLSPGTHGSTFGGNPICCAASLYTLSRLTAPGFLDEVAEKGAYMEARLAAMPHVQSVRGHGMMLGAVLDGADAKAVASACAENGLLVLTAKSLLRLLPPLIITKDELAHGLDILERTLAAM